MTSRALQPDGHVQLAALVDAGQFAEAWEAFRTGSHPSLATPEAGLLGALSAARTGRYAEARRTVTTALRGLPAEADPKIRLRGQLLSGGIALERGEVEEAEGAFTAAAELAREGGHELVLVRAWNNLGIVTHLRRHPLLAIRRFRDALRILETVADPMEEARVRHNLGLVLREHGEFDRAEREVSRAVALADTMPDRALQGLTRLGRAELELARGQQESARANLEAARQLIAEAQDRHGEAEALRVETLLALEERRFAAARPLAREARRRADQIGARLLATECMVLEALALNGLWKPEEAEAELAEAVRQAEALGAPKLAARFWAQWARRSRT